MKSTIILLIVLAICGTYTQAKITCSSEQRDVVLILDASESISANHFKLAKTFMVKIISFLKMVNSNSRIAFIVFGDDASLVFNFNKYSRTKDIIHAVMGINNGKGLTAIGKALRLTLNDLVPQMRKDALKMVILLTDGSNNIYPSPYSFAESLKSLSVQILTIGIGSHVNANELMKIASPNLVINVANVFDLLAQIKKIIDHICVKIDHCETKQQDLVILLDSSQSIGARDYETAKAFITKLLSSLQLGSDKVRVALISFSDQIRVDFDFKLNDPNRIFEIVKNLKKFGTATAIGLALREARVKMKPQQRSGVPFNVLLLTDGANNMYPKPAEEAQLLKQAGANIITVGIGNGINLNELRSISTQHNALSIDSYNDLMGNMKTILKSIACC